jgi:hypothetical protein
MTLKRSCCGSNDIDSAGCGLHHPGKLHLYDIHIVIVMLLLLSLLLLSMLFIVFPCSNFHIKILIQTYSMIQKKTSFN